jgi:uncharacterized protein YndB with AHSA1/START domain
MKLQFDFNVDKATETIYVAREFAAGLDLVWDAWTKAEMLDKWWGPKPWRAATKEMDFREGGRWLYAMVSPENQAHWCLVEFIKIDPKTGYSTQNSFCDENGNSANSGFTGFTPISWDNTFKAGTETTTVDVVIKMASLDELERFLAMGFKEGFTMGLGNLDEYLSTLVASK